MTDSDSALAERVEESDGGSSSSGPDYESVKIPTKPPSEYSYVERRADILQQVRDLGHPRELNQSEVAERFGVSQQQVSRDLDRLGEYVKEELPARSHLVTDSVVQRSLRGLVANEEWNKAGKMAMQWHEFVEERTKLEQLEERLSRLEERGGQ